MAERTKLLHDCTVSKVTDFGQGYFELFLECPELAANLKAGQFINVRVRDGYLPLLRRLELGLLVVDFRSEPAVVDVALQPVPFERRRDAKGRFIARHGVLG
jgi:hypothetical protein